MLNLGRGFQSWVLLDASGTALSFRRANGLQAVNIKPNLSSAIWHSIVQFSIAGGESGFESVTNTLIY